MKNRLSFLGQTAFGVFLAISAFGTMTSCSDNYELDSTTPSFLGGSIYDELKARGTFQTTLRLIDDLEYSDVLSKTGSKTIFVANDDAYRKFFETQEVFKVDNSDEYVRSYEQLSPVQKKHLLNNAMLNNPYVLEMMANCADGDKNLCLRQTGAASPVDYVSWVGRGALPVINTEPTEEQLKDRTFSRSSYDFWYFHLKNDRPGLYMAENEASPLITHFLEGQMNEKHITHDDISFLFNKKKGDEGYWDNSDSENRSYVFDAQIVDQDIVCMNGYIHVLDKVLVAPGTMADEIRNNGSTNIFSHILDRFSTPYYNAQLTENYNALAATPADSIFERRYLAQRGPYNQIRRIPNREPLAVSASFSLLTFDPGWTEFKSTDSETKEKNMGAMFVPNDEALRTYFLHAGGRVLMERYALDKPVTEDNLLYNLDQIPLDIIQALVNNLMKVSFNETVPSKYLTIMNDARDQMFPASDGYATVDDYKAAFDKTLVANNGVVYVMNKVISPADYASVIAPVLYGNNTQVMRAVVRADDNYIQGSSWANAPLQQYFSTYLKAMQSRFSLFVPTDEGLATYGYIDPATFGKSSTRQYWRWTYYTGRLNPGKVVPIESQAYSFNIQKGHDLAGDSKRNGKSGATQALDDGTDAKIKKNLLIEMVNQHIVVHPNNDVVGVRGDQKYFLARTGAPVIIKDNEKEIGMKVSGGLQEYLARNYTYDAAKPCTVVDAYDQSSGYGNGMTYLLDRPLQPTVETTFRSVSNLPSNSKFLELCMGLDDEVLENAGLFDALKDRNASVSEIGQEAALYYIFLQGDLSKEGKGSFLIPEDDKLVRFFNNYRYTVYVPTDEALDKEIENGLPTWDSIRDFLEAHIQPLGVEEPKKPSADEESEEYQAYLAALETYKAAKAENDRMNAPYKEKAQAMINTLVNFLKYHFQDESVFLDNVSATNQLMTAAVANDNYVNLSISQTPGQITLTDAAGRNVKVSTTACNYLARDTHMNSVKEPKLVESSSYVVVHQLAGNQALHYKKLNGERWDNDWNSAKRAKAFLAKYGTQK